MLRITASSRATFVRLVNKLTRIEGKGLSVINIFVNDANLLVILQIERVHDMFSQVTSLKLIQEIKSSMLSRCCCTCLDYYQLYKCHIFFFLLKPMLHSFVFSMSLTSDVQSNADLSQCISLWCHTPKSKACEHNH